MGAGWQLLLSSLQEVLWVVLQFCSNKITTIKTSGEYIAE